MFVIHDCEYTCLSTICLIMDNSCYNNIRNIYPDAAFRMIGNKNVLPLRLIENSIFLSNQDKNMMNVADVFNHKIGSFVLEPIYDILHNKVFFNIREALIDAN